MGARSVQRGEVYLTDLARAGGVLEKNRPVLVVQNEMGNRNSPETIVAAVRSADARRDLPVFVRLLKGTGGLHRDCVVDAGHLHTIPQASLGLRVGVLPRDVMDLVDRALEVSLGLEG